MFLSNDVIDLQPKEGVFFVNQAVLASISSSVANFPTQCGWDMCGAHRMYWRAFAFASRIKCSSCNACSSSRVSASVLPPLFWRSSSSRTRATAFSEGWNRATSAGLLPWAMKSTISSYASVISVIVTQLHANQFSSFNSSTLENSSKLFGTSVASIERAWAAICVS
jgi:hypothetical protein